MKTLARGNELEMFDIFWAVPGTLAEDPEGPDRP